MKAYISCPLDEPLTKLRQVAEQLEALGYNASYYERGNKYTDTQLKEAGIFVLISSSNQFDFRRSDMTHGCRVELESAYNLGKPLYLAYWKTGKGLRIYHISLPHFLANRVMGKSKHYLQPFRKSEIVNTYSIF